MGKCLVGLKMILEYWSTVAEDFHFLWFQWKDVWSHCWKKESKTEKTEELIVTQPKWSSDSSRNHRSSVLECVPAFFWVGFLLWVNYKLFVFAELSYFFLAQAHFFFFITFVSFMCGDIACTVWWLTIHWLVNRKPIKRKKQDF